MIKKQTIIDSALKLFSTKGFEGTSVREIAADAGVNVAMINYYFLSKEKLFESVVEYRASVLQGIFTELVNNTELAPIEKMDIVIDQTIERKFSNSQFHHLLHRELSLEHRPQLRNAISDILLKNMNPVKKIIQNGIKDGVFKPVDIELTLTTLLGTIHYLLTSDTMCRKILGKKEGFSAFQNNQLKKRLSEHTKQLMRSHLLKK
ncbi:MAG TPA: TetR family transcriptional regulator [Hanamia sp.]|jgi:AcrR family transcriptional regulator|nr:TetR family transcriptional regulator [Hanamia sp.]